MKAHRKTRTFLCIALLFPAVCAAVAGAPWQPAAAKAAPKPEGRTGSTAAAVVPARAKTAPAKVGARTGAAQGAVDAGTVNTDQRLQALVRRRLQEDPVTRPFAAQATVKGGIASLAGRTFSPQAREAAQRAVERLPGVAGVRNGIVVRTSPDLEIAQKLRRAFAQEPGINAAGIAVTVIRGNVYLSGTARSAEERERVNQIAFGTPGVQGVSDGLQLTAPPARTVRTTTAASRTYPRVYNRAGYR